MLFLKNDHSEKRSLNNVVDALPQGVSCAAMNTFQYKISLVCAVLILAGCGQASTSTSQNSSTNSGATAVTKCGDRALAIHPIESHTPPADWNRDDNDVLDCEDANTKEEALAKSVETNSLGGFAIHSEAVCARWVPKAGRLCVLYQKATHSQVAPEQVSFAVSDFSGSVYCVSGDGSFESAALKLLNSFVYSERHGMPSSDRAYGYTSYAAKGNEPVYNHVSTTNPQFPDPSAVSRATAGQSLFISGKQTDSARFSDGQFCMRIY
jgi:hypothetical protein